MVLFDGAGLNTGLSISSIQLNIIERSSLFVCLYVYENATIVNYFQYLIRIYGSYPKTYQFYGSLVSGLCFTEHQFAFIYNPHTGEELLIRLRF